MYKAALEAFEEAWLPRKQFARFVRANPCLTGADIRGAMVRPGFINIATQILVRIRGNEIMETLGASEPSHTAPADVLPRRSDVTRITRIEPIRVVCEPHGGVESVCYRFPHCDCDCPMPF